MATIKVPVNVGKGRSLPYVSEALLLVSLLRCILSICAFRGLSIVVIEIYDSPVLLFTCTVLEEGAYQQEKRW